MSTGSRKLFGDSTPPTVSSIFPANSDTDVSATPCVCITFSEQMAGTTIDATTITVKDSSNNAVNGAVSYDTVNKLASFNPSVPLGYSKVYTVTVKGGSSGVKDTAGNPLATDFTSSFTTLTQPASGGTHAFAGKWGSSGVGNAQFNEPFGVAVDPSTGTVYIADRTAHNIQAFKSDGTFITKFGSTGQVTANLASMDLET